MSAYITYQSTHNEDDKCKLHIEWQLSYVIGGDGPEITGISILSVHTELVGVVKFPVTFILQDEPGEKLLIAKYWPELECVMDGILRKCADDWEENRDIYDEGRRVA